MDSIEPLQSSAEDTAEKQRRGRPFEPGKSGNPNGRPKGSRNKATLIMEAILEDDANAIVRQAVDRAKEGNPTALRLCFERLLPARRDRPDEFDLPPINNAADAVQAAAAVIEACANGTLSPNEAATISGLIKDYVRTLEVSDFEERLNALEKEQSR